MREIALFFVALTLGAVVWAQSEEPESILTHIGFDPSVQDCDTLLSVGDYAVRVAIEGGRVEKVGLNLFSDDIANSVDADLLGYIEEALLYRSLGLESPAHDKLVITQGSVADFKQIGPQTDCTIRSIDSKILNAEWTLENGGKVAVTIPIAYDTNAMGSRTEIENAFIAKLRGAAMARPEFSPLVEEKLTPYGEDLYIYPGTIYLKDEITRNTFFTLDSLGAVWDAAYPLESMSNLFVYPCQLFDSVMVDLTILKHEYGEKESLTVPLQQLLAVSESEGCQPFWGVESFADGRLAGALFLYNFRKGYDHVLKVECTPAEVIAGTGRIEARASLYIPTNNVHNLYAPYVKKTEDEKIKYQ